MPLIQLRTKGRAMSPTTRRKFVQQSAVVVAGGLVSPYFFSSRTSRAESANDRLRIG
ncbi:MAG TPA: twin-arginine translocation signal domain-containing protein, partial [Planctomycetaceae bacterium]|nr:twin-arginine translocation signal domain-containing protein [Planctomycetaceae bacterium]